MKLYSSPTAGTGPGRRVITDQYAGYKFIVSSRRQLCCSHVARNVIAIGDSVERVNLPIGARLLLLAETVFRTGTDGKIRHNTCAAVKAG